MRILVTRPEADAGDLAARLASLGHTVAIEPLLDASFSSLDARQFDDIGAIVVTSRNALRSLAASDAMPDALALPIHVVGPGTERAARDLGFTTIIRGPGSARKLADTLDVTAATAPGRPLLYLAGETLAFDLKSCLEARGLAIRQVTAYRTVAAKSLSTVTVAYVEKGEIGAVLLMSPRTAAIYGDLIAKAGLRDAVRPVPHLCLSPNVAAALQPISPQTVMIAAQPSLEELLALLPT